MSFNFLKNKLVFIFIAFLQCLHAENVTIVSYNILNPNFLGYGDYSHLPADQLAWEVRKDKCIKRIMHFCPDIICLQEMDCAIFEDWKDTFQSAGFEGVFQPNGDKWKSGVATYYRTAAFKKVEIEPILCKTSQCGLKGNRSAIVSTFETHFEHSFYLINTKFKWFSPEIPIELNSTFRQAMFFKTELINLRTDYPWVLAGDFNVDPNHALVKLFIADGFVRTDHGWTCFANGKKMSIDHILVQESLTIEPICVGHVEAPIPNKEEPSDHLPVAIKLLFDEVQHAK